MRIFYAADHTPNAELSFSNLWYYNLYLPLKDLGHEVIVFDYNLTPHFRNLDPSFPDQRTFIKANRPKLEESLLEQIRKADQEKPIDLFFSYFYSACCRAEIIAEIKKMGICTLNWYCNASYQFHLVKEIAPAYDYCLVPEKFRLADYRSLGANPIYLQEAANPNIYKPYNLPYEYEVTFTGQKYGDRLEYISFLYNQGIKVRVWGWGWRPDLKRPRKLSFFQKTRNLLSINQLKFSFKQLGYLLKNKNDLTLSIPEDILAPPLTDEELIKMYSRSKISLGFSSCGETSKTNQRILQIRLRDFEAPMSGAFYMTEQMEELEEFFEPGKEIICYSDKYDLADKVRYYLSHPEEREKIRQAGYRRAVNEHTWQKRFEKLFKELGL